jgi:hypothetical protein
VTLSPYVAWSDAATLLRIEKMRHLKRCLVRIDEHDVDGADLAHMAADVADRLAHDADEEAFRAWAERERVKEGA